MNKLMLACVLVLGLGCGTKKIPECEEFVATIDKLTKCDKLPADGRKTLEEQGKTMRDALKMVDNSVPQEQLDELARTCKTQNKVVVDQFAKITPDCVK